MTALSKTSIRTSMRQRRRGLPASEQRRAAHKLLHNLLGAHVLQRGQRVALYLPHDGEIDTTLIVRHTLSTGSQIFLPVLSRGQQARLQFRSYIPGDRLRKNRYGIPEPIGAPTWNANVLDLILVPLVAFDRSGARLGMGGGYYDSTLEFLKARQTWVRPKVVGLAYAFQEVAKLPNDVWDIPLHAIATDQGFIEVR